MPSLNHLLKGLQLITSGIANVVSAVKNGFVGIYKAITFDFSGAGKAFEQMAIDAVQAVADIAQGKVEIGLSVFESLTAPLDAGLISNKAGNWLSEKIDGLAEWLRQFNDKLEKGLDIQPSDVTLQIDGQVLGRSIIKWIDDTGRAIGGFKNIGTYW